MKAKINWIGEVAFKASADSGHEVLFDGAPEFGGRNLGPRPMELVLIGMGGCTVFDIVHSFKKDSQDCTDCVTVPKQGETVYANLLDRREVGRV